MIKLPKINLDNIKKMGEDLVGSVTSGDALGKIKSTVGAKGSREVLPEELQQRIKTVEEKIEGVAILQKSLNDAISELKKEAVGLCKDAVSMYQPKKGGKETTQPKAKEPKVKEEAAAPEEPVAPEEKPSEESEPKE